MRIYKTLIKRNRGADLIEKPDRVYVLIEILNGKFYLIKISATRQVPKLESTDVNRGEVSDFNIACGSKNFLFFAVQLLKLLGPTVDTLEHDVEEDIK